MPTSSRPERGATLRVPLPGDIGALQFISMASEGHSQGPSFLPARWPIYHAVLCHLGKALESVSAGMESECRQHSLPVHSLYGDIHGP